MQRFSTVAIFLIISRPNLVSSILGSKNPTCDPRIDLPSSWALPPTFPTLSQYANNFELCVTHPRGFPTVGCDCPPGAPRPNCNPPSLDSVVSYLPLMQYCSKLACTCSSQQQEAMNIALKLVLENVLPPIPQRVEVDPGLLAAADNEERNRLRQGRRRPDATCRAACSSNNECSSVRGRTGCEKASCLVRPKKGQPKVFSRFGSCSAQASMMMNRLSGRAIEQNLGCPCNSTYVSKACCGAGDDGIVWEGPTQMLGILESES